MPKQRFGQEFKEGKVGSRGKRFSFVKYWFFEYDSPHGHLWHRASRSWKKYRKTQYKPN